MDGKKARVIIRQAPEYNPVLIERIIREGLEEIGLASRARGRITIKPNVVMAHHKIAPSGYTRPEFLEGVVNALRNLSGSETKITVAEKSGSGLPTSRMFRRAGYFRLKKEQPIRLLPIEEARKKTIRLQKGVIHKTVTTAREVVDNDFLIYIPKLKTNYLAQGLTAALKLNIGILCDRERMWNHNYNLDEKIVDLLEAGYPDFIATDAIEISMGGNQFTQHGRHLGIVLISNDPLAHDVVCARIFHLEPKNIRHLALASSRGYGSIDLQDIEIAGDISLEAVRERTKTWDVGFIRVDEVKSNIRVLSGEPYCCGGCQGVFLDWLYMIKDRKPKLWKRLPRWTVVIGKYRGDVTAEKLMILGSCSGIEGKVKYTKKRRIKGCPPRHKDLVLWFFLKAGILNPLFRVDLIFDAYFFLFLSWTRRFLKGRL
ncbi:MAG: DUF362 domain-containing protein [Candidatus Aminicenantales bacterium]